MPVLYEGTLLPALSSASPPSHHSLSPTRHNDVISIVYSSVFDPLAWLCVFAALSALLSLYLQIRGRNPSVRYDPGRMQNPKPALSPSFPPTLPFAAEESFSDEKHDWREPERGESLAASYYDLQDDLGMDMSSSATTTTAAVSTKSITSCLTEEPAQMTESEMWTREAWEAQIDTQEKNVERIGSGNDNGTSTGNENSKGMNTGTMDLSSTPVRRRSYTKMKTIEGQEDVVQLNVQGEIVVAEGWRRHTRVYGGGVCLACAESERKMKSMTV